MSLTHEEIVEELVAELKQRDADRKLLAEVLAWSRANGYDKAREYESGRFSGYSWKVPHQKLFFCPHFDPTLYWEGSAIQPGTVREAVDVLCALKVLPAQFSAAFQAGRESAYDRDEWRVAWVNRGDGEIWSGAYYGSELDEQDALSLIRNWRREHNPAAWLEHRRVATKPGWVRVPEAGGTDAQA